MTSEWTGRALVNAEASGPAMVSMSALSFLGDIDIRTGMVVEESSDIKGRTIAGCVLVIPQSRGSAGAWRFLYQLRQHGTHPAALITETLPDPSVVQGAIMCGIPVVSNIAETLRAAGIEGRLLSVCGPNVRLQSAS